MESGLMSCSTVSDSGFMEFFSHVPGVVFELQLQEKASVEALQVLDFNFSLVSEGCFALLGCQANQLQANRSLFFNALTQGAYSSFMLALRRSAAQMNALNWEGALLVNDGQEMKWINVRAMPRLKPGDGFSWKGFMANVTEARLAKLEVSKQKAALAELSEHLQVAKEMEREAIARDLHDELGSLLVAIRIKLSWLSKRLGALGAETAGQLEGLGNSVASAIEVVSRVVRDLRPGILRDFGLFSAVECYLKDFQDCHKLQCSLQFVGEDPDPKHLVCLALYRILQEALTNVVKHAEATSVDVHLKVQAAGVMMCIVDDGKGFSFSDLEKANSFGIRGMRERVLFVGGSLDVLPADKRGTCLQVFMPWQSVAKSEQAVAEDCARRRSVVKLPMEMSASAYRLNFECIHDD